MENARKARLHLTANFIDRAATACFTVGVATPTAGYLFGLTSIPGQNLLVAVIAWLIVTA